MFPAAAPVVAIPVVSAPTGFVITFGFPPTLTGLESTPLLFGIKGTPGLVGDTNDPVTIGKGPNLLGEY